MSRNKTALKTLTPIQSTVVKNGDEDMMKLGTYDKWPHDKELMK